MNGCTLLTWLMLKDSENKMNVRFLFSDFYDKNNMINRAALVLVLVADMPHRTATPGYS